MKIQDQPNYIISADIGGSHITAAIIDVDQKKVLDYTRKRAHVDCQGTAEEILAAWILGISETRDRFGLAIDRLALAMPGPFDYGSGISYIKGLQKYEALYQLNIKELLATGLAIPSEHIRFRNDAEAFLHGEVIAGAGAGVDKVVGITLGTGMGSAVSNFGITTDANWGSDTFGNSIADDYFSTRWFLKAYSLVSSVHCVNVKELAELAQADQRAAGIFASFAKNFASFITNKLMNENPDVLVIGGNISKAHTLFLETLRMHLAPYLDPSCIYIAGLGEDAALIGAAFTFDIGSYKIKN